VPTYFGHLPESTAVNTAALEPLSALIDEALRRRGRNRGRFEGLRPSLDAAGTPGDLAAALGTAVPPGVVEELPSGNGGPGLPLSQYTNAVKAALPRSPNIPPDGSWSEAPWRNWRVSGANGVGSRSGISDRTARGTDTEAGRWAGWPGWLTPGGGSPWPQGSSWDGWRRWGENQTDRAGGWSSGGYASGGSRNWWQTALQIASLVGALSGGGGEGRGGGRGR